MSKKNTKDDFRKLSLPPMQQRTLPKELAGSNRPVTKRSSFSNIREDKSASVSHSDSEVKSISKGSRSTANVDKTKQASKPPSKAVSSSLHTSSRSKQGGPQWGGASGTTKTTSAPTTKAEKKSAATSVKTSELSDTLNKEKDQSFETDECKIGRNFPYVKPTPYELDDWIKDAHAQKFTEKVDFDHLKDKDGDFWYNSEACKDALNLVQDSYELYNEDPQELEELITLPRVTFFHEAYNQDIISKDLSRILRALAMLNDEELFGNTDYLHNKKNLLLRGLLKKLTCSSYAYEYSVTLKILGMLCEDVLTFKMCDADCIAELKSLMLEVVCCIRKIAGSHWNGHDLRCEDSGIEKLDINDPDSRKYAQSDNEKDLDDTECNLDDADPRQPENLELCELKVECTRDYDMEEGKTIPVMYQTKNSTSHIKEYYIPQSCIHVPHVDKKGRASTNCTIIPAPPLTISTKGFKKVLTTSLLSDMKKRKFKYYTPDGKIPKQRQSLRNFIELYKKTWSANYKYETGVEANEELMSYENIMNKSKMMAPEEVLKVFKNYHDIIKAKTEKCLIGKAKKEQT